MTPTQWLALAGIVALLAFEGIIVRKILALYATETEDAA